MEAMFTISPLTTQKQALLMESQFSSSSSTSLKPNLSTTHVSDFSSDLSLIEKNSSSSSSSSSFYLLDTSSLSSLFSSSALDLNSLESPETGRSYAMDEKTELHVNASSVKNGSVHNGEPVRGSSSSSGKIYPPPISCLKLFKTGKPYTYLTFNEDDESFVLDEIRIPNRDIFRAARSGGRLKLYFDISADEPYGEEEEKEEGEAKKSEKKKKNKKKK